MFPWWPKAIPPGLCLALILPLAAGASIPGSAPAAEASDRALSALPGRTAPARDQAEDPFLAAMLGALPLMSGFYLTSTPQKGAVFTLADAMLIGTIVMIRTDKDIPPKDVSVYYYLLGGVNVADAVLSVLQARSDAASRLSVHLNLNPLDAPGFRLAWRF